MSQMERKKRRNTKTSSILLLETLGIYRFFFFFFLLFVMSDMGWEQIMLSTAHLRTNARCKAVLYLSPKVEYWCASLFTVLKHNFFSMNFLCSMNSFLGVPEVP